MPGIRQRSTLQALGLLPGARRRAWSALLVLVLALASFTHVAHSHDADAPSVYKQHCSYCSTFDRGGAPPPALQAALPAQPTSTCVIAAQSAPVPHAAPRPSCRPRAPPFLQA